MYDYRCYFSLYSKFKMPKKILVIDDNDDILDLVREVLETNNYEAICLNSSDNIIKSVTELQPDLVITDYILTGINGGEFCAEIKKKSHYKAFACNYPICPFKGDRIAWPLRSGCLRF